MNTETIIQCIMAGMQIIAIIAYTIAFFKINKTKAKDDAVNILQMVPHYLNIAKARMPEATTLQITNYVLAMIKSECEEAKVKYKEKTVKEAVEKEIEK